MAVNAIFKEGKRMWSRNRIFAPDYRLQADITSAPKLLTYNHIFCLLPCTLLAVHFEITKLMVADLQHGHL